MTTEKPHSIGLPGADRRRQDPCRHRQSEKSISESRGEKSAARGLAPPRHMCVPSNPFVALLEKLLPGIFQTPDYFVAVSAVVLLVVFAGVLIFATEQRY
jgi:hypothetical protein